MNTAVDWCDLFAAQDAARDESEKLRASLHEAENTGPMTRKAALSLARDVASDAAQIAAEPEAARHKLGVLCDAMRVTYPLSEWGHRCEVARLTAVDWWGRKLRVGNWRTFEERKHRLAQIDRYCSDEIASAYVKHQHDIRHLLEGLVAYREDAEAAFTLAELAEKSKANPVVRRAAMFHQLKGVARLAIEDRGWTWAFFTLTAPGRYHRVTTVGKGSKARKIPNRNWCGTMPRDAQEYLCTVLARARAKLDREGVDYMYWRVAEPHTDGCPHWHGMFFANKADLAYIRDVIWYQALRPVLEPMPNGSAIGAIAAAWADKHYRPRVAMSQKKLEAHVVERQNRQRQREWRALLMKVEPGAIKARFHWNNYRPWAARKIEGQTEVERQISACLGYCATYIGKNIDGKRADESSIGQTKDRDGRVVSGDAIDNAVRVVAWASLWGIRQFQFGGGEQSGPYEELRRLRASPGNALSDAWQAADADDFAGYSRQAEQLGLALVVETSRDRLLKIADEIGVDAAAMLQDDPQAEALLPETYLASEEERIEERDRRRAALLAAAIDGGVFNRWGEPSRRWVTGVTGGGDVVDTRPHEWRVVAAAQFASAVEALGAAGRRLVDVVRERIEATRDAATRAAVAVLSAFDFSSRSAKPNALGPGPITVRSHEGSGGSDRGPPDDEGEPDWYFVNRFGFEQAAF